MVNWASVPRQVQARLNAKESRPAMPFGKKCGVHPAIDIGDPAKQIDLLREGQAQSGVG
jgi:hypothetical protein